MEARDISTEFASPKYFEKLRSQDGANDGNSAQPGPAQSQAATFTLPIRPPAGRRRRSDDTARSGEQKRRLLGHDLTSLRTHSKPSFTSSITSFRLKVSAGNKGPLSYLNQDDYVFEEEPVKEHLTLHDLFMKLPNELQLQIIAPLPVPTILNLRLVSRSFHALVALNESPIARYHVTNSLPTYALRLYPLQNPTEMNLRYLCGIWHRLHVVSKLAVLISEQTTQEIFLRDTEAKRLEFQPQHTRMRLRLVPLIFTMFHFFEKYRELHIRHLSTSGIPLCLQPFTLNPIERQVMDLYDDETLLKVHQIFPLVLSSFSRRLRPPSYIGRLERSIKGYLKDKPADEIYATILTIGGLRQAERFWEPKGYNSRRAAVDTWYGYVIREPVEPVGKSSRLSMITGIGRKKPVAPIDAPVMDSTPVHDALICNEWYCVKPSCADAREQRKASGLIFHTSLAAGPPMSPLSRDQLRLIITDQQPLTNIWLHTAEAVILDRQIVENSLKIKRNTQVLLELIRDDGAAVEEWTPGLSQASWNALQMFQGVDAYGGDQDL